MNWFSRFRRPHKTRVPPESAIYQSAPNHKVDIRRHFYNEPGFQTYASFFTHWGGWITAGHCMTDVNDILPPFARGDLTCWPDGLDGALIACELPDVCPVSPKRGQKVIMKGFPAGSRHMEQRSGTVYFDRSPGVWIAHIESPDEPVVTGMSGGPVLDGVSGVPIGIVITRNSPADLNSDRDPDESCDFVSLAAIWEAMKKHQNIA